MNRFVVLVAAASFAAPALAQASPPVDWSKPVVGVDAPLPAGRQVEPVRVEVLVRQDIAADPAAREFAESLSKPAPPPCEPAPTANAPASKPAGPSPCPAQR